MTKATLERQWALTSGPVEDRDDIIVDEARLGELRELDRTPKTGYFLALCWNENQDKLVVVVDIPEVATFGLPVNAPRNERVEAAKYVGEHAFALAAQAGIATEVLLDRPTQEVA